MARRVPADLPVLLGATGAMEVASSGTFIQGNIARLSELGTGGPFGVIVADPPWQYQQWSERKQGSAKAQYDLMSIEAICGLSVAELAADDAALFLWGTWPKLPEALAVLVAWGFGYVTGFPWVKLNRRDGGIQYGVGFWVRGCSEFILIGRRGNVSPPKTEGFLGLLSPTLGHSRKPESIYQIAESLPGPYLELFGRRSRPGWVVIGNEQERLPLFEKSK